MPRCDVFFEMHPFDGPDGIMACPTWMPYLSELRKIPKVYGIKPEPEVLPQLVEYPIEEMDQKYGPYFWTSSFSYMIPLAIKELLASPDEEKVMGFWGVDCSATEEYGQQRPGAHFFFMKACEAGIKVICPPESDLLMPPARYGYCQADPWHRKQMARKREYEALYHQKMAVVRGESETATRLMGALDDIQWNLNTWGNRHHLYKMHTPAPKEPSNGTSDNQPA